MKKQLIVLSVTLLTFALQANQPLHVLNKQEKIESPERINKQIKVKKHISDTLARKNLKEKQDYLKDTLQGTDNDLEKSLTNEAQTGLLDLRSLLLNLINQLESTPE